MDDDNTSCSIEEEVEDHNVDLELKTMDKDALEDSVPYMTSIMQKHTPKLVCDYTFTAYCLSIVPEVMKNVQEHKHTFQHSQDTIA